MKRFSQNQPPAIPSSQPTLANLQSWAQSMVQWGSQLVGKLQSLTVSTADIPAFQNTVSPTNELAYLQVSSTGKTIVPRTASQVLTDIGVPVPAVGNELDMIRVNAGGTAYEARTPAQVLTDIGAAALAGSASQNFSVADATTAHQAVAREQVINAVPVGAFASTTGTTISATTGSFTAPSTGAAMVFGDGFVLANFSSTAIALTSSLSGLVSVFTGASGSFEIALSYLPMTSGQSSTFTSTVSNGNSTTVSAAVRVFFLPLA